MALGYRITITDSKGGEIVLSSMKADLTGKEDIISASYKSNTLNDDSMARSNDVRAEIKIIGRITKENIKNTCELAKWSNETNTDLLYRKVKLTVYTSTDSSIILRNYEISEMFVLDYEEAFDIPADGTPESIEVKKENDNGIFAMYLAQKSGNYDLFIETE